MNSTISTNYIALDISKENLAVCSEPFRGSFSYDQKGLDKLLTKIRSLTHPLVVCEASGGYERKLMDRLHEEKIPAVLLNPGRVRAFACSEGIKAKTDPIDAALLLRFAQEKKPQPTPPPSPTQRKLQDLMDRRSQLTETLAREKNRLQEAPKCVKKSIEKMIRILEKEIAAIERQIEQIIQKDPVMREHDEKMQSVVGVAHVTSWTILTFLPEIDQVRRNELVALAGIAPYNNDSGKFKGKRRIKGGRAKVRKALYMATQSAAVHNPHIKAYVDRLRARGKPYKCAIVAAMRKLLIHLQSLLKNPQISLA